MNYKTENSMPEAVAKERQFSEFFKNVKAFLRQCDIKTTNQKWNEKDYELNKALDEKQKGVYEALCDNFDTAKAIELLSQLVNSTNSYIIQDKTQIKIPLVRNVSKFIFKTLKTFGVYEEDDMPAVGEG